MEIIRTTRDGIDVISLHGKLDTIAAGKMEPVMLELIRENIKLEIDMSEARYICSAALRVFLETQKEINKLNCGEMVVLHCNQGIKEVFEMTGFSGILNIKEE
ncbi:MAG: STAS domain-containing protein [Clostridium sp.]